MNGRRTPVCAAFLLAAGTIGSLSADPLPVYTNHAAVAIVGAPVRLTAREVTLSNACETERLPLSVFPEGERRRIAADYVAHHPEAGTGCLLIPSDIRRIVDARAASERRSRRRAEKGLCTQAESDAQCARERAVLKRYLDEQEKSGRLLSSERRLFSP